MQRLSFRFLLLFLIGVILLAACNLPGEEIQTEAVAQDAAVTETMQAVATIVAQTLAAAVPTQAEIPTDTPAPPSPEPVDESATPTLTATITPTSAPQTPTALVNQNTNCRSGPGTVFDIVYPAPAGVLLTIVSNTDVSEYVIVAVPDQSGKTCWLWTRYSEVTGDLAGLPVATSPPTPTPTLTPTPTASFSLSFALIDGCVGWDPGFKVFNSGGMIFKSYLVTVKDNATDITINSNANLFDRRNGCIVAEANPTLDPGEEGYVYANSYLYDPTGHSMTATVTLCTEIDLNGVCVSQTIQFTP